jgi:dolichyl-phosphate-mannose-protein mannosyltransferase
MPFSSTSFKWFPPRHAVEKSLSRGKGTRKIFIAIGVFLITLSVRALYWNDHQLLTLANNTVVTELYYRPFAQSLVAGNFREFIGGPEAGTDATFLGHPPGYPLLIALSTMISNQPDVTLQFFQASCDALSAALIFLIAIELLPTMVAVLASGLIAFSPKYAFYSLVLTPESLAVMPVLLATLLFVRAGKHPSYRTYSAAGALIGISCWLRSDALLLAPFLALITIWLGKFNRWRYALTLVSACMLLIAPITLRNLILFHRFVPVSIGAGTLMQQGIAEYDSEKRFGLPISDVDIMHEEAKTFRTPEYEKGLWTGDGIDRDHRRLTQSLNVISYHPFWFMKALTRRAYAMFTEDHLSLSMKLMAVAPNKGPVIVPSDLRPVWSASPTAMYKDGLLSNKAQVAIEENGASLYLRSDYNFWGDQIISTPIQVRKQTSYVFRLPVATETGRMAFFVKGADMTDRLATSLTPDPTQIRLPRGPSMSEIYIPFNSQNEELVYFTVAEGGSSIYPVARIGPVELFELGVPPSDWTQYPRAVLRDLQQVSMCAGSLSVIVLGLILLMSAGLRREAALVLAIPVYYLCTHSVLHLEQRYVLPMYYMLMIVAAIPFYWVGKAAKHLTSTGRTNR